MKGKSKQGTTLIILIECLNRGGDLWSLQAGSSGVAIRGGKCSERGGEVVVEIMSAEELCG